MGIAKSFDILGVFCLIMAACLKGIMSLVVKRWKKLIPTVDGSKAPELLSEVDYFCIPKHSMYGIYLHLQ